MTAPYPELDSLITYPAWADQLAEASPYGEHYLVDNPPDAWDGGLRDYEQVEPVTGEYQGVIGQSFFDDFYFRIHIIPGSLNLGNLASEQSQDIYFWNAYFNTRTLTELVETDTEGLEMSTPALPFAMDPLGDAIFTLLAGTEGPPTINANFAFVFDEATYDFVVTGNRAVTLAYPPDRDSDYEEEFYWPASSFTASNGKEQLISLSDDPKISAFYNTFVTEEERWSLEAKIWGWQSREYTCPVWKSSTSLADIALAGSLQIAVASTEHREFRVGGLAMLFFDPERNETVEITGITPTMLEIARPTINRWPKGATVLPIRQMRLSRAISYGAEVANTREFTLSLSCDSAETQLEYTWPWVFDSLPVLEFSPDMKVGLAGEYSRNITPLETTYGKPFLYDRSEVGTQTQDWLFTFETRMETYRFISLLTQLRGSCGFFWAPSWSPDIEVVQAVAANSNVLVAKAYGMANMYKDLRGKHGVRIELRDGTILYRRVTEITRGSAPGTEEVTLDTNITQLINVKDIRYISFMAISRFAQDRFRFKWTTVDWAEVKVAIKGMSDAL